MKSKSLLRRLLPLIVVTVSLTMVFSVSHAFQGKTFEGEWTLTITRPAAPGAPKEVFVVNAVASPRNGSLHGRVILKDSTGRTFPGVWRQSGKKASITFELPCNEGETCGTLVLVGKIKPNTRIKKGDAIVLWDTPNDSNPALFDTSKGTFTADRVLQ
jgi:hypothetical protein